MDIVDGQRDHWQKTYEANPMMYGSKGSEPVTFAIKAFTDDKAQKILELGAGQGRDTLAMLQAGLCVTAIDYAKAGLDEIGESVSDQDRDRLELLEHDLRNPLPYEDDTFDGCYSHMLFTMAFSNEELIRLMREVNRVLRKGAQCIYTVRHTGDVHYGQGEYLGDDRYSNGGFVVHFFDRDTVERLAEGFDLAEVVAFEEGELPRQLWLVRQRKIASSKFNDA